jgi:hypothetical protein
VVAMLKVLATILVLPWSRGAPMTVSAGLRGRREKTR